MKKGLLALTLVSLFAGLMVTAVGIAVFPSMARVAEPVLCPSQFEIRSRRYFVPPNTKGVGRNFYCPKGKVDTRVFFISWCVYSFLCFLVFAVVRWMYRRSIQQ